MYRIIFIVLLCTTYLYAQREFKDCGSKVGHYVSVKVSDCTGTQEKCILKRNTNATIQIEFNVDNDTTGVTSIVHGVVSKLPVPFPLTHPDACNDENSGLNCPLSKNAGPYTYTTTLFVQKTYPKISLEVKWELKDQNNQDIVCVEIPAKIQ